jgi:hypothetical protein
VVVEIFGTIHGSNYACENWRLRKLVILFTQQEFRENNIKQLV